MNFPLLFNYTIQHHGGAVNRKSVIFLVYLEKKKFIAEKKY